MPTATISIVPTGLPVANRGVPSDKSLGYCHVVLTGRKNVGNDKPSMEDLRRGEERESELLLLNGSGRRFAVSYVGRRNVRAK
jgi:hypothetical protein